MLCPIGAETDEHRRVRSLFPADLGVEQGACVLGVTAARLLRANERIYGAACDGEPCSLDGALDKLAGRLAQFEHDQVAFLVDANRPLEGLEAVFALRSDAAPTARVAPVVPPEDEVFVRAGAGACPAVEKLAACDLVVAIGDPFSTHPVISRPIRDMQYGARGNRFLSIDVAAGRTGRTAHERLVLHPFALAGFVCATALECGCTEIGDALGGAGVEDICGKLGLSVERVRSVAEQLRSAQSAAIVLSCSRGRYAHAGAVLRAAAALAKAVGAALFPLPVCANTPVLGALSERHDAESLGGVLAGVEGGDVKALVVLGVDLENVLPARIWGELNAKLDLLAWAGALDSALADVADVVVPLALPWEESGTVVGSSGQLVECQSWSSAPAGVLTLSALAAALGEKLGAKALEPASQRDLECSTAGAAPLEEDVNEAILNVPEVKEGEAILVSAPEPYAYGGTVSVSGAHWQRRMASQCQALVSGPLAIELGIGDGQFITLSNGAEAALPCAVRNGSEAKVVAVPSSVAALRELLDWRLEDGRIAVEPAVVKVSKLQ